MQVGECARGDAVEGQSAGRPVQVHSYSPGAGGGGRYVSVFIIVSGRVTIRRALQTPGLVITSKQAVSTPPFPLDALICHCYLIPTTTPLSLPVAASRQTLSTQHLFPVVKSLWVVRTRLLLTHMCLMCHLSVPLREREMCVCCVWVQCELTGICRQEERTSSSEYGVGKRLFTAPTHTHTHTLQTPRSCTDTHTNRTQQTPRSCPDTHTNRTQQRHYSLA